MSWIAAARSNPLFRWTAGFAVMVLALDQVTKLWILHGLALPEQSSMASDGRLRMGHINLGPIFDLSYVRNTGVSFGLFAGGMTSRIVLSIVALAVAGFVIHWAARLDRKVAAVAAGLIVGGALGNTIDRVAYGHVVDFLDFSGLGFPWVFNVADAAINVGVALLAYDAFFGAPKSAGADPVGGAGVDPSSAPPKPATSFGSDETVAEEPFRDEARPAIADRDKGSGSSE